MKILIVGLGVIGSAYGYLFQSAGHYTEHFIRVESKNAGVKNLSVSLLDGRETGKGEEIHGNYLVHACHVETTYDFIFLSVPEGGIVGALALLKEQKINGTILLACGIWENRAQLQTILSGWDYILGYPVAGGNRKGTELTCCVFDHFMLERREKTGIANYEALVSLFDSCHIKIEQPDDMLEWIWLHMAINAGVISTAGKYGDLSDTSLAAEKLMDSSKELAEAILAIRETCAIIESRNVNLKKYRNELWAYSLPRHFEGIMMKKMFADNILTRKIMTLHNNLNDLLFVCQKLYTCGKSNRIPAPIFYDNYQHIQDKIKNSTDITLPARN